MTLLDAPEFDEAPSKRRRLIVQISAAALFVLLVIYWLVASRPVDWPWRLEPERWSVSAPPCSPA